MAATTAQKLNYCSKQFFSEYDQISRKLWIWSHLQEKSLMEDSIFCVVNGIQTHNHLVRKSNYFELNNYIKLAKWLSCVVSNYRYGAFRCAFLSCHIHALVWLYNSHFPECLVTAWSKQVQFMRFNWMQWGSNPQPFSL